MKTLTVLLIVILFCSCMPSLHTRVPDRVVVDKHWDFFKGYALELDDTLIFVSRREYKLNEIGDTL